MKKKCLRLTYKLKSKYEKLSLKGFMVSVYQLFEKIHLFLKDNHPSSLFQSWQMCAVLRLGLFEKSFRSDCKTKRRCTLIG